jgi:hypothetical protein
MNSKIHYPTTLAAFTLIILFSGMLKFSKTIFFPTKTFAEIFFQEESICQNENFKFISQQTCVEAVKASPFGERGRGILPFPPLFPMCSPMFHKVGSEILLGSQYVPHKFPITHHFYPI